MKIVDIHTLKRQQITPDGKPLPQHAVIVPFFTKEDGASLTMRFHTILPNNEPDPPLHGHPWEHQLFTISGQGAVLTEQGEFTLKEGVVVFIPPDEPHILVCRGELPWVCIDCASFV